MFKKLFAAAAIAVAVAALAGLATAGGTATQQKIAFSYSNDNPGKTTLVPLTSGSIVADQGLTSWCCWTEKTVQQDGEPLEVNNPLATFMGKRGSLKWRELITWHDVTNGYSVASGTWRIVGGTGAYEHLTGHGHLVFIAGTGDKVLAYRGVGLVGAGR